MNRYLSLLIGAGLLAGAGLAGSGSALAAAPAYFRQTTAAIPLSATGGTLTKIELVTVTPGNWSVTGKAQIVNFGANDIGRCALLVGGTQVDGTGTELGGGSNFPAVAVLVTQYAFTAKVNTLVQLACFHDADVDGQYVDPSASLMVVQLPPGAIR